MAVSLVTVTVNGYFNVHPTNLQRPLALVYVLNPPTRPWPVGLGVELKINRQVTTGTPVSTVPLAQ